MKPFKIFAILLVGTTSLEKSPALFSALPVGVASFSPTITRQPHRKATSLFSSVSRRDWLKKAVTAGAAGVVNQPNPTEIDNDLLLDIPMTRLKLPRGGLGRDYIAIPVKIDGKGPFEFMLDSGLTTELITPHLQQSLGINSNPSNTLQGLAAGGGTSNAVIKLSGASLIGTQGEMSLPPLTAVISDFPQEHIDPAHDPVEGMLGMELLSLFDVDFDFEAGRVRLYRAGKGAAAAAAAGLVEIPAAVINESLLYAIRLSRPGVAQPVIALVDCGSTFTTMNWKAAEILGLPPKHDIAYAKGPEVMAVGVDGRPLRLRTFPTELTFAGNLKPTGFEPPPSTWKPWQSVSVAVGDLPVFADALGDGETPYTGPAALLGLDVLAQRRFILETGQGRPRRLFVSPRPSLAP